MKKLIVVLLLSVFSLLHIHWSNVSNSYRASEWVRDWILEELKKTQAELSVSLTQLNDRVALQKNYHNSRKHYKHIEFFVEFCSPREAKSFINGPLVPKGDLELSNEVIPPQGFQRIEELLFTGDSLESLHRSIARNTSWQYP